MKVAADAFLHACISYFLNSNSTCVKIAKSFAAANKPKFLLMLSMHYLIEVTW